MRRALVPLALAVLCVFAVPAAGALEAGPCACRGETEREVTFYLHRDGFVIVFDTTDNDGEETAFLGIRRGRLTARYLVPAVVTGNTVKARFSDMGEVDYRYTPIAGADAPGSAGGPDARFEGTFTFEGENDYIHLDLDKVRGFLHVYDPPGRPSPRNRRLRRAVPYRPAYTDEGATLNIVGGSKRSGTFREVSAFDPGGRRHHAVLISAALWEERPGGLEVSRGAVVPASNAAFRWNTDARTATVRPPGPFTGSAKFTGRADGAGTWTGSLRVPILGGEPIELAGPGFRGHLHEGVPIDE